MVKRPAIFGAKVRGQSAKEYDARRGTAAQRGYGGKWVAAIRVFKADHPLCLGCQAVDRYRVVTTVDHTIPHKGDLKLFWNRNNWQPSCGWHHNVVKQALEGQWSRGTIGDDALRLDSPEAKALTLSLDP
jgi:5-methylcytosine-specific restriction protein A